MHVSANTGCSSYARSSRCSLVMSRAQAAGAGHGVCHPQTVGSWSTKRGQRTCLSDPRCGLRADWGKFSKPLCLFCPFCDSSGSSLACRVRAGQAWRMENRFMNTLGLSPALTARLRRTAVAASCVPPAVLLHEFGHWIGYVLAGIPDATVHYASSGFRNQPAFWNAVRDGDMALAGTMASVAGAGIAAFLGIAVSWGLMVGGALLVRRPAMRTVAAAMVFASAVRFVPVGLFLFCEKRCQGQN